MIQHPNSFQEPRTFGFTSTLHAARISNHPAVAKLLEPPLNSVTEPNCKWVSAATYLTDNVEKQQSSRKDKGLTKLENVAIAKALQLEAGRRRAVPLRFNNVARGKFEVAQPIRCRLRAYLLLIHYVTL